jgi:hypothetical protein
VGFGWESPELRFGRRRASRLMCLVPLQEGNLQGLSAQEQSTIEKNEQLEALPCGRGYGAVSSVFF